MEAQNLELTKKRSNGNEGVGETKRIDTDRIIKPNLRLSDSFTADGDGGHFDFRLPLETPDFKGRIELMVPKVSGRTNQASDNNNPESDKPENESQESNIQENIQERTEE